MKNGIRLWLSLSIHVIIIMFVMVFITGTLSFRFFSSDIHSVTARLFPLISLLIAAILVCALNIFGKNYQHFWQNILGKWEPEIVLFKPPVLSLILRILL